MAAAISLTISASSNTTETAIGFKSKETEKAGPQR